MNRTVLAVNHNCIRYINMAAEISTEGGKKKDNCSQNRVWPSYTGLQFVHHQYKMYCASYLHIDFPCGNVDATSSICKYTNIIDLKTISICEGKKK